MRGVVHPLKQQAIEDLKKGMAASQVSKKYNIALSTLTAWIKTLPPDCIKSKYDYRNRRISAMRRINLTEAKISDMISKYIINDITDDEWESFQNFIQHQLIDVALVETKIMDMASEYIVCDISTEDWVGIQNFIRQKIVETVISENN